jgi:predicted permease
MNSVLGELKYALRRARARIGFTTVAVLSLGLGIGVNTAAFSLVDAIILRKTPLSHPERVAEIYSGHDKEFSGPLSYPDYKDLRAAGRGVFSQFSLSKFSVVPRDMGDHVETLTAQLVNGDYFPLIGLGARLGRLLGPEDDMTRGGHPVIVISYDYWRNAFSGDSTIVGKTVRLGGRPFTIVGVAPKTIEGLLPGLKPAIYASIQMIDQLEPSTVDDLAQRGNHSYFARVRLADGQSLTSAHVVIDRFVGDMRRLYPKNWSAHNTLLVFPLSEIAVTPFLDDVIVPAASALMIVVGLVLIIACANLASFLLAQARDRQREIAIRLAIGASRRVLVRQLLVESLALAFAGGAVGVLFSSLALRTLLRVKLPIPLPINLDVSLDARVLAFVLAASVIAGVLFGLLPAMRATRADVIETIKNENAGAKPGRRLNMRSTLVVAQTAISLVLLVTAALFLRSFAAQSRVDPGFGSAPTGLIWMAMPTDRYGLDRQPQGLREIEQRMRALPNVENVGIIENVLLNALNESDQAINVDGFTPPKGESGFSVQYTPTDSGFFDAAGIRLLSGRVFNSSDLPTTPRVAVINEAMAKQFWPTGNAVGRTFRADTTIYHIIGIAKQTKIRSLGESPQPFFFLAFAQDPRPDFSILAKVHAGRNAELTTTRMMAALHEFDPALMIIQAKTMQQHLATMVLPAQLGAVAFALFAGLALVLAMIGIYGVVRYAVARRSREVAIRLAVGASPSGVVRLLMREGLTLVGAGAVIGIVLGLLASRALQSLLYGVAAIDPVAFIAAGGTLVGVGALAAFLPARRASRVDPASALRAE